MDNQFGSVTRRTEKQIEQLANSVRRELGVEPSARLAMQPVLEFALDDMIPGAYLQVLNDNEMAGAEGRTDWHQPVISLSASTYTDLGRGRARARMTAAHELGHLLMHTQRPVYHYRTKSRDHRVSPEWQANYFASCLLMPAEPFRKMRMVQQAMRAFGVSRWAALYRARHLGVVLADTAPTSRPSKKKGYGMIRTP